MESVEINKIIKQLDHIPALPQVVTKVLDMMKNPNTSMTEMGKIISADIAFSSKILKIVNSAFYGLSQKVSSLSKAVTILGFNTLRSAIIGVSIIKSFGGKGFNENAGSLLEKPESLFAPEGLWAHSLGVASCARVIAKKVLPAMSEEGFITGILHDIGKLIIHQFANEVHNKIIQDVLQRNVLYSTAEINISPIPHSDLGFRVATMWNLPPHLCDAVKFHHDPSKAPQSSKMLVTICHVADTVVRSLQIGSGWDNRVPKIDEKAFDNLNIAVKDIDKIIKDTLNEYNNANIFSEVLSD